ncbi:ribosomal RNA small subunit methyltransferase A [bacterium]|nr:ribosomal RNA small subunit methyltransferase A [bacterium]
MFVDTHAHIDFEDFTDELDNVISRAWDVGVRTIVIPSIEAKTMQKAASIAESFPHIWFAAGWHPSDADSFDESLFKHYLGHPKCIAIGEIGLDFYREHTEKSLQIEVFRKQLGIAADRSLPVIIHIREAWDEARKIIDEFPEVVCDFHAFSGGAEEVEWIVQRSGYMGLGGPLTFKNFKRSETIETIPMGNILLETDCPFLAPHPHRGNRNEPSFIPLIADKVAEFKSVELDKVEMVTTANLKRFLGIPMPISISNKNIAKRSLSQNFLCDDNIIKKFVSIINKTDLIIEIGAGNGEITSYLPEKSLNIWVTEPDWGRIPALKKAAPETIILPMKVQNIDLKGLCSFEGKKATIVGNLPYADSSQIIFQIIEHRDIIDRAIIMIQKEFAERLCACPGSKKYGIPSVLLSLFFDVNYQFDVSPHCFKPVPRVDSSVISMVPRKETPAQKVEYHLLKDIIKSAFSHRRKTIANSMKWAFGQYDLIPILKTVGINPSDRAENISPESFVNLAIALGKTVL